MELSDENSLHVSNKEIQQLTEQSKIYAKLLNEVVNEAQKNIVGKKDVLNKIIISIISEGHILLESVPGLAKTLMVKTMAQIFSGNHVRIQFTPDLLPADIVGTKIFKSKTDTFQTEKGPIFHNFVLADEINRAPPKVQSALLEAMGEMQTTVDGITHLLPSPFMVIATQNSIEYEGTFPLPEGQLDRFMLRISLGYPSREDEISVVSQQILQHPIDTLEPVASSGDILGLQEIVKQIHTENTITEYAVSLVTATRNHPDADLGASPRGSLALFRTSQALALIRGRDYVLPDDVKEMAIPVLGHRVIVPPSSRMRGVTGRMIVEAALEEVQVSGVRAGHQAPTG